MADLQHKKNRAALADPVLAPTVHPRALGVTVFHPEARKFIPHPISGGLFSGAMGLGVASDDLVRGSSSIWTLYSREGCAHSGLTRTSLRATFSRCAPRSSMARCSPELRKKTPLLSTLALEVQNSLCMDLGRCANLLRLLLEGFRQREESSLRSLRPPRLSQSVHF